MGLLAPWFLAGLAAIALPIWLHFLRRNRTNLLPFSSLMFFDKRPETSVQPRRLRYLALLSLRIALLAVLALAFANPFISRSITYAGRKRLTVIAVDRSFSMRDQNRMEQARREAEKIISELPGRTLTQAVALDARVENLTSPTLDRSALTAAVAGIQPSDLASSYAELVRALRGIEQSSGMALDVHLVSDMQQSSMPVAWSDLRLGPHTSLTIHSVGSGNATNFAVESLNTAAEVYNPKQTRVSAVIAGWQTAADTKCKATLLLDGKQVETKEVSVAANGRAQVEFLSFNVPYGAHRGEVRIDSHDQLPADDSMRFAVNRSDPRPVLFLGSGKPRESFFYKAALESAENTGLVVNIADARESRGEDFGRYAFVVLADADLDAAAERKLGSYAREGGSLLVLLGRNNAQAGHAPVTGASIKLNHETQGVGFVDGGHPALAGPISFANVQFFSAAQTVPVPAGVRVLARLADGSPLLVEQSLDEGRVLTFASTFDASANDLPLHKAFLPLVVQSARYLANMGETPSNVTTGSPVELRRSRGEARGTADVVGPDGHHELSLRESASAGVFVPQREGFYEIQRANGQRTLIAAHADRRESDLTRVPAETLALWNKTGNGAAASVQTTGVEHQVYRQSLWRYLLVLLLGIAVVESVFGSKYLEEEKRKYDGARTTERVLAKT